ncbi:MAG: EAL domain-containing protein [Planctomycetes bacterium]|nr:EAL domain-containing protein [Planctomycetota bacterium]
MPDLILQVDRAGRLLGYKLSGSFEAQISLADLVGHSIYPSLPEPAAEAFRLALADAESGESVAVPFEYRLVGETGGELIRELRAIAAEGDVFLLLIRDVTRQRASDQHVRLMATLFEHTTEGVVVCDGEWRVEAVNRAFVSITGYKAEEVTGSRLHPLDDKASLELRTELADELESGGAWRGELHARRKNGEFYPQWSTVSAVRGPDGAVSHYLQVFTDLSRRGPMTRRLGYLHHYDALTGLSNERLLLERLSKALAVAEREGGRVALLRFDFNCFRTVNDSLGYEVGDQILARVSERLRAVARMSDTCARLHADEFVLVLEDLKEGSPSAKAREILQQLREPFEIEGHEAVELEPCLGIALFPPDAGRADALLRNAGIARDRLKARHEGGFEYYSEELGTMALRRNQREQALRRAHEEHQLVLFYQPKVDVMTQAILGAEALLRWRHPSRGLVPPLDFVPLAEETGLILPIGEWVLEVACRQTQAWRDQGFPDLTIAVNLSPIQLQDERLLERVDGVLERTGLAPAALELEITESCLLEDLPGSLEILSAFRKRGIKISLDDFGTGHSSLSLLCQLPIDVLKIDKSFLDQIPSNHKERAILDAIVNMGHSLDMEVVAEGVEAADQLQALRESGCDQLQGYFFSRPVPAQDFKALLLSSRAQAARDEGTPPSI